MWDPQEIWKTRKKRFQVIKFSVLGKKDHNRWRWGIRGGKEDKISNNECPITNDEVKKETSIQPCRKCRNCRRMRKRR